MPERIARNCRKPCLLRLALPVPGLNLQAWQTPPMWVRDLDAALREPFGGKRGDREAAELLQRMLDAGLSKYEPDPLAALDQAMRSAP